MIKTEISCAGIRGASIGLQMKPGLNFRERLREWRKHMETKQAVRLAMRGETRFTQADAAAYLGVPLRTYEAWEREKSPRVPIEFVKASVLASIKRTYTIRRRRRYV